MDVMKWETYREQVMPRRNAYNNILSCTETHNVKVYITWR